MDIGFVFVCGGIRKRKEGLSRNDIKINMVISQISQYWYICDLSQLSPTHVNNKKEKTCLKPKELTVKKKVKFHNDNNDK